MALCSIDDINSYLPAGSNQTGIVVEANDVNADAIQISVLRVIRGYLSRILTVATMASWIDPEDTPDIIREVAAMLVASQLFINQTSGSTVDLDLRNYGQVLYDRAVMVLQEIVNGTIIIPDIIVDTPEGLEGLDFFPVDDTDRAFTMGMRL